ncbi:MAG: KpsF/GutQ family sugar-phosphate isomerase [Burkholderiales bacterium]
MSKSLQIKFDPVAALERARRVLTIEAEAVLAMRDRLNSRFTDAMTLILSCRGRVVVSGMGKSGHVGSKIAATLASTGTPAFFVHPGEASHGDLGMITHEDVCIALSNSGESAELTAIVPLIKRRGARLITITGNVNSTLAREADVHLDASVAQEACPLNLAPTASTTAALALGDALSIALLEARGFGTEDFARTHPGGALGRRLLIHVRDIMHQGERLPKVVADALLPLALLEMTRKGLGMTAVVDKEERVLGIITDGDLRRLLEKSVDVRSTLVHEVMTPAPYCIAPDQLAVVAVENMQSHNINGLLVVDQSNKLVGALNMLDLLRAGVV